MIAVDPDVVASLAEAHYRTVRCVVHGGPNDQTELLVVEGQIQMDSSPPVRRNAQVSVALPVLTTDAEAVAFAESLVAGGVWVEVWWDVILLDKRTFSTQIGLMRAESADWQSGTGIVQMTLLDLGQQVVDDRFLTPRTMSGASKVAALTTLVQESVPGYSVSSTGVTDSALQETTWDRERGDAVTEIARALGAWLHWLPVGGWRLEPVPDGTAPAAWTVASASVNVASSGSAGREQTYNAVVANGQVAAGDEVSPVPYAVVYDTDPTSPTWWDGSFGHKPRFYSSPVLATNAQCVSAATALLSQSKGLTRALKFDTVAHPGLEPGDVIEFTGEGPVVAGSYLIDEITLPFGPTGMSVTARRVA